MNESIRVLVVEDSEDDALLLIREIEREGYIVTSERVETAAAMEAALGRSDWDLVISDYSMPHFSGTSALELFRKSGLDLPFILVSGAIGEKAAVEAMKSGAHDYIMKGHLKRLVPTIERELREASDRKERRRAEEQLRQSEEQFRQMAENIEEVFYLSDPDTTRIIYISPAYERIWGNTCASLYENPQSFVDAVVPRDRGGAN